MDEEEWKFFPYSQRSPPATWPWWEKMCSWHMLRKKCPFLKKCSRKVTAGYYLSVCCTVLHTTCPEYRKLTEGEKTPSDWEKEFKSYDSFK